MNEKMNLLMAINKNYFPQMETLLYSLASSNNKGIDLYLMHRELTEDQVKKLDEIVCRELDGKLYEINLKDSFLDGAKIKHHFSVEMYYRIFASEYLPSDLERILWLDADIVVIKSIKNFYFMDFCEKSMVVCAHREKNEKCEISKEAKERLKLSGEQPYFNSGVILMNLEKIRGEFNHEYTMNLILKMNDILNYPDQDILNILYRNDVLWLDYKEYNYQIHYDWKFVNEKEHIENNVKIIHYAGPAKPWQYKSRHFSYEYYWKNYLKFGSAWDCFKIQVESILYMFYIKTKKLKRGKK